MIPPRVSKFTGLDPGVCVWTFFTLYRERTANHAKALRKGSPLEAYGGVRARASGLSVYYSFGANFVAKIGGAKTT